MRIAIFEDDSFDTAEKYSSLIGKHELAIFLAARTQKQAERALAEFNFTYSSLSTKIPLDGKGIPQADLYFIDGLQGDCFRLLVHLPRDKSFIYTRGMGAINERAREEGHSLILGQQDLERVIAEHSSQA